VSIVFPAESEDTAMTTPNRLSEEARAAFEESLAEGRRRLRQGDINGAWPALERAHVLGQPDAWLHVRSHGWMLWCGLRKADIREVFGQLVRLALSAPSSWLGRYPRGNTGRARVGMLRPMSISTDLEALLSGQ
jgi:hypothetical protein